MPGRSRRDSAPPKSVICTKYWNSVKKRKRGRTRQKTHPLPEVVLTRIDERSNSLLESLGPEDSAARQIIDTIDLVEQAQVNLDKDPKAEEVVEVYRPPPSNYDFNLPSGSSKDPFIPEPVPLPPALKSILRKSDQRSSQNASSKSWWRSCYDPATNKICDRNAYGCLLIVLYTLLYMTFLAAFTSFFLFMSLQIIKSEQPYIKHFSKKSDLLPYSAEGGIGLTATPTSVHYYPLIWYKLGSEKNYEPYVKAIDNVLGANKRRRATKANLDALGPCGKRPYGYGEKPCVIIRINKELDWSAKPLQKGSPAANKAPSEVRQWLREPHQKLWLHCEGGDLWVKEHLSKINYFPYPPGFEPSAFPLHVNSSSPLVGVQFAEFTKGLSLDIKCTLWYDQGISSIEFTLYVNQDLQRKAQKPRS